MKAANNQERFKPWMPRHLVIAHYGSNDYAGSPFRRFKPADMEIQEHIAHESARHVNAKIRILLWRSRKGTN